MLTPNNHAATRWQPTIAYWNGKREQLATLSIPVEDRAFFFGDAIYEVIRIYGGKLWLPDQHFLRLFRSLDSTGIRASVDIIAEDVRRNVAENGIENGYVYIQVSRGTAPRNHAFPPAGVASNILIYSQAFAADPWLKYRRDGINVILEPDIRWLRRDIKSVNLLANCLAKQKAEECGAQEVIFIEHDETVTEASSNNVFIVQSETIVTAPANNRILNGVTRLYVLDLAKRLGVTVNERAFSRAELLAADEVFITGTTSEVLLVSAINGIGRVERSRIHEALRREFTKDIQILSVPSSRNNL